MKQNELLEIIFKKNDVDSYISSSTSSANKQKTHLLKTFYRVWQFGSAAECCLSKLEALGLVLGNKNKKKETSSIKKIVIKISIKTKCTKSLQKQSL